MDSDTTISSIEDHVKDLCPGHYKNIPVREVWIYTTGRRHRYLKTTVTTIVLSARDGH